MKQTGSMLKKFYVKIFCGATNIMNKGMRTNGLNQETSNDKLPRRTSTKDAPLKFKTARLSRRTKKALSVQTLDESATRRLETFIPRLAKNATTRAYRQALISGSRVLIVEAGDLLEVHPNGTRRFVKKIEPSVKVRKGQIIKIK